MKALFYEAQNDLALLDGVSTIGKHNRSVYNDKKRIQKAYGRYKAVVRRPYRYKFDATTELTKALKEKYTEGRSGEGIFSFIKERNDTPGTTCCPYCGRGGTGTIDHYLPQSSFPLYAIFSMNLVPACSECQAIKNDRILSFDRGRPIHPLLDAITLSQRLSIFCDFEGETLAHAVFKFDVIPIKKWPHRIRAQERKKFIRHWRFFDIEQRQDVISSCHLALNDIRIRLEEDASQDPLIKTDASQLKNWLDQRIRCHEEFEACITSPMLHEALLRGFRSDLKNAELLAQMPLPSKGGVRNRKQQLLKRR